MPKLNLDPLEKALQQLEVGLNEVKTTPGDELRRDGIVLRFEYSLDLACKTIELYVTQNNIAPVRTRKELFQETQCLKLIPEPQSWLGHCEVRRKLACSYNSQIALTAFQRASAFLCDANDLLRSLRICTQGYDSHGIR
jgi:hypothetical protein